MSTRARSLLLVLVIAALAGATNAAACVMCGSSFGDQDPTMNAFKASVLFLVVAPYAIFFSAAAVVYFLYRRSAGGRRASVVSLARWRGDLSAETPKEVTP
jgi:hypothetical protein